MLRTTKNGTLLLLLLFACLPLLSWAAPSGNESFERAKAELLNLWDQDPKVLQVERWQKLTKDFALFVSDNQESPQVPEALFLAGRTEQQVYEVGSNPEALSRAVSFYERLARNFPGNEFTDDGLLFLGDLRQKALRDEVAARAAYFEIIDMYPNGNAAKVARERLRKSSPPAVVREQDLAAEKADTLSPKPESRKPARPAEIKAAELLPDKEKPKQMVAETDTNVTTEAAAQKKQIIVLDPGHGGEDEGAIGVEGLQEKDVVLEIAFFLQELLEERLQATVVLTREKDLTLSLEDRMKFANAKNASLFVSIHANASPRKNVSGIETYYLDNTNDKSSMRLAHIENQGGGANEDELSFVISDFIQGAKMDDSISLAHHVQKELISLLGRYYRRVNDLGVKRAPFMVLVGAHMPCILVEVAFIDQAEEGKRLADRRYQRLIAEGLFRGIDSFLKRN